MIPSQIKEQLLRLSVLGTFKPEWLPEYTRCLEHKNYTHLIRAVDRLVESRDRGRYPLPAEIIVAIQDVARKCSSYVDDDGSYRDGEITGVWAACFRLCWMIKDNKRREHEFNTLTMDEEFEDKPQNKPTVMLHYEEKYAAIAEYLRGKGVDAALLKRIGEEKTLTPTVSGDEKLPF